MNNSKVKKPSSVGGRKLGQQHHLGKQAALGHYSSNRARHVKAATSMPDPALFFELEVVGFSAGSNGWASGCCPFHDDHNPSFAMNLETGGYFCRSANCGVRGSNLVSFVSNLYGVSHAQALLILKEHA